VDRSVAPTVPMSRLANESDISSRSSSPVIVDAPVMNPPPRIQTIDNNSNEQTQVDYSNSISSHTNINPNQNHDSSSFIHHTENRNPTVPSNQMGYSTPLSNRGTGYPQPHAQQQSQQSYYGGQQPLQLNYGPPQQQQYYGQQQYYVPQQQLYYGHNSPSNTIAAIQKLSVTPPVLIASSQSLNLTLTDTNKFLEFKQQVTITLKSVGLDKYINLDAHEHWLQIKLQYQNIEPSVLYRSYVNAHQRICGMLELAVLKVAGDPEVLWGQIKQDLPLDSEYLNNADSIEINKMNGYFIENNANLLWMKIISLYEQTNGFAFIQILNDLLSLRYNENEDPQILYNKLESVFTKLDKLGTIEPPLPGRLLPESIRAAFYLRLIPKQLDSNFAYLNTMKTINCRTIKDILLKRYQSKTATKFNTNTNNNDSALVLAEENEREEDTVYYANNNKNYNNKQRRKPNGQSSSSISTTYEPTETDSKVLFYLGSDEEQCDSEQLETTCEYENTDLENNAAYQLYDQDPDELKAYQFILDSGSSKHIAYNERLIKEQVAVTPYALTGVGGSKNVVTKRGAVNINARVRINDVNYIKGAGVNLMSVVKIVDAGNDVLFTKDFAYIIKKRSIPYPKITLLNVPRKGNAWILTHTLGAHKSREQPRSGFEMIPRNMEKKFIPKIGEVLPSTSTTAVTTPSTEARNQLKSTRDTRLNTQKSSEQKSGVYYLSDSGSDSGINLSNDTATQVTNKKNDNILLHEQFGHQTLLTNKVDNCNTCALSKLHRTGVGKGTYHKATQPLETISFDVLGPVSISTSNGTKELQPSLGGSKYSIIGIDKNTSYTWAKPLAFKSESASYIKRLIKYLNVQHSPRFVVKHVHSDGGGEFVNNELSQFYTEEGIKQTYTTANSPFHNGQAERMIQTLTGMTRSMLTHSRCSTRLWGEGINYAVYIRNRTPLKTNNQNITPYELLHGIAPSTNKIKVFGCDCVYKLLEGTNGKFEPVGEQGTFVGVDEIQNCYRIINKYGKIIKTRDATFNETSFINISKFDNTNTNSTININSNPNGFEINDDETVTLFEDINIHENKNETTNHDSICTSSEIEADNIFEHDHDLSTINEVNESMLSDISSINTNEIDDNKSDTNTNAIVTTNENITTTRSGREIHPPSNYGMINVNDMDYASQRQLGNIRYLQELDLSNNEPVLALTNTTNVKDPPQSFKQAINSNESDAWKEAIDKEIDSLNKLKVFKLIEKSKVKHIKLVGTKWVFDYKINEQNEIIRHKARLVVLGCQQTKDVNFTETFAPVAKVKSIKLLLSLAAQHNLEIHQLDYDTAFLNAQLDEEVYIHIPQGFDQSSKDTLCFQLLKSLYGLRQASRQWHKTLHSTLIKLGYQPINTDPCIYIKYVESCPLPIILCLYVDDTLVAFNNMLLSVWLHDKAEISKLYPIKDIGQVVWILGMEVVRNRDAGTITLSQAVYIENLLNQYSMSIGNVKTCSNPGMNIELTDPQLYETSLICDTTKHAMYRSLVGALLYAANTTRIDIAQAVCLLSRFVSKPTEQHLTAAKHILRYLAGTINYSLMFKKQNDTNTDTLTGYSDSDWGGCLTSRKSTAGGIIMHNGNVITWNSKKQRTVAKSSCEAEYMSVSNLTSELQWFRMWLFEVLSLKVKSTMYCDNQGAIALAKNDANHTKTKHIDIHYHFVREVVNNQQLEIKYVPTKFQLADILTKTLVTSRFIELCNQLITTTTNTN
jgi:hypothetical protein